MGTEVKSPASALGFLWHEHAAALLARDILARSIGACIDQAIAKRGRAVMALAGGKTPMPLYRALADQPRDWSCVHLFPTDERWVTRGHPARNEDEILAAFAAAVGVTVHGLIGAEVSPRPTAEYAIAELERFGEPFDVVLLGMGQDTHTASLFPHSLGLEGAWRDDADPACVVVPDPLPAEAPFARITMSRRRLHCSRALVLLIGGAGKREVFERVAAQPVSPDRPVSAFLDGGPVCQVHWSP